MFVLFFPPAATGWHQPRDGADPLEIAYRPLLLANHTAARFCSKMADRADKTNSQHIRGARHVASKPDGTSGASGIGDQFEWIRAQRSTTGCVGSTPTAPTRKLERRRDDRYETPGAIAFSERDPGNTPSLGMVPKITRRHAGWKASTLGPWRKGIVAGHFPRRSGKLRCGLAFRSVNRVACQTQ